AALVVLGVAGSAGAAPLPQSEFIEAARNELERELIDYTRARFREVRLSSGGTYMCGMVNSPNRAGGMTGWRSFIVVNGTDATAHLVVASSDTLSSIMADQCGAPDRDWIDQDFSSQLTF